MATVTASYTINRGLVNVLIASILGAIIAIGGYMVAWNGDDKKWKSGVDVRLVSLYEKIGKIETQLDKQILPQAEWRLDQIDVWIKDHESRDHRTSP
jgi:hypothetical protein